METEDYEDIYRAVAKRINGGNSHGVLDRLKKEFESKRILTIQNFDKLMGARMDMNGNSWKVDTVEETTTGYYFVLVKMNDKPFINEVRIGLSRVPMAGKETEMYNLFNETYGGWLAVGKGVLKDKDTLMRKMIELTELPF